MYNSCSRVKSRFVCALAGMLALLLLAAPAGAATYTWDGGGADSDLLTAANWNPDSPAFNIANSSSNTASLLVFTSGNNGKTALVLSDADTSPCFQNITFNADAPSYTLSSVTPGLKTIRFGPTNSDNNTLRTVRNDSPNTQTFDLGTIGSRVDINAAGGDIVFSKSYTVSSVKDTTVYTQLMGPGHIIWLNGGISGNSAMGVAPNPVVPIDSANGLVRIASGTTYITAASASTASSSNGGFWNGQIQITDGVLRISHDKALGAGFAETAITGYEAGRTTIGTSTTPGTGRLELVGDADGSITSSDYMVAWNRSGSYLTAPAHIKNVSGTNTLTGKIINGGGAAGDSIVIEAADDGAGVAELLTLGDAMAPSEIKANITGTSNLVLRGNGVGLINHAINNKEDNSRKWELHKLDGGTWTIASGSNTYSGKTVIEGGTLALGPSGSIAFTSAVDVKSGATFNVSAVSGGFNLASINAQTLSGSGMVNGSVLAGYGGATIVPGALGTAGTLTISNDLALNGPTALQFDLANVTTVGDNVNDLIALGGALSLSSGTVNVNMLNGALATGTYRLISYSGPSVSTAGLTLTGVSSGGSRQSFGLDSAAGQLNLVVSGSDPLNLTWAGNGTNNNWDLTTTQDWNAGAEKFYNGDLVNFTDAGSISPAVNLTGNLEPGLVTVNNSTGHDYTFSGTGSLAGATDLTKEGTGKLTIANSGTNTFTGTININGGTVAFNYGVETTESHVFTGAGNLQKDGSQTLILSGVSPAFAGTVTVADGVLKIGAVGVLGATTGGTTVNGGTLDVNGLHAGTEPITLQGAGYNGQGALVTTSSVSTGRSSNIILGGDASLGGIGDTARTFGVLAIDVSFQGNNYKLTKVGSNVAQIRDTGETNLGDILVNEGGLAFYGNVTMGNPLKTVTVANNAILSLLSTTSTHVKPIVIDTTHGQFANWQGNNTVNSTITMNGNLALLAGSGSMTLGGTLTGAGNLTVDGLPTGTFGGTIYLTSDNNNYTGTTTINSGVVSIGKGGTTGSLGGTGDITFGANGALMINRQGTVSLARNIVGSGLPTNAVQYGTADNVALKNVVYNVSGNNTYIGDTNVYEGAVVLSTATGLGDTVGKTTIAGGSAGFATVVLTNGITVAENFDIQKRGTTGTIAAGYVPHIASASGSNTLSGTITTGTGGSGSVYTISSLGTAPTDLLTISGTVNSAASGSLWLRGPGKGEVTGTTGTGITGSWSSINIDGSTWTFSAINSYTGITNINSGSKLVLSGVGSIIPSAAIGLTDSTAILDLTALTDPTHTLSMQGAQALIGNGTVQGSVATTSANLIAPSRGAGFNQLGGTMTITENLTLAGAGETLQFKLMPSTTDPKNDVISVGGVLNMNGSTPTLVSIVPNTTLTQGSIYMVLTSPNVWTGSNTFVWDSVNNKTRYEFSVAPAGNTLQATVVADNHATLTWSGTDTLAPGVWNVKAAANWTGGPADNQFWQADAVNFTDASTASAVTIGEAVAPASITVSSDTTNYVFSGAGSITGGTGIDKSGAGTLTISNTTANDYTGVVNITGGTLKIVSTTSLGSNQVGTVINGGTLDLNGVYNIRREPISVAGLGVGGNGALVNNLTASTLPFLYYVTLAGEATVGGSFDWSIQGPTLQGSGDAHGYLHGNGNILNKVGGNYLTLNDLGDTNLGDIHINGGRIILQGNTSMGNETASRLYLANGSFLSLTNSTWIHAKPVTVEATGGRLHTAAGTGTMTSNIENNAGSDVNNIPMFIVSALADATLNLNGVISGGGGLSKYSAGKVVLGGANTYAGETFINEGILELAASGQILNSAIRTDVGTVFQVVGPGHTMGTISGTGTMNVLDGAGVTATSITQTTLTIGSPALAANAAVPEPGTWLLLLLGLLAAAGLRRLRNR
jgi:fibronectin-binding autotransporter adhesin